MVAWTVCGARRVAITASPRSRVANRSLSVVGRRVELDRLGRQQQGPVVVAAGSGERPQPSRVGRDGCPRGLPLLSERVDAGRRGERQGHGKHAGDQAGPATAARLPVGPRTLFGELPVRFVG